MRKFAKSHPGVSSMLAAGALFIIAAMVIPIASQGQEYWLEQYGTYAFVMIFGVLAVGQFRTAKISSRAKNRLMMIVHYFLGIIFSLGLLILALGLLVVATKG